jgi:outer membrane protein assembly factor BamB
MLTVRRAEIAALGSTAIAFALTVLLAGTGYAVESNGFARGLLESVGWIGAGVLALVGEVAILEGYRRLERGAPLAARVADRLAWAIGRGEPVARLLENGAPRAALGGAWSVAGIGLADVAINLYVLASTGVPASVSRRLLGAIAIVMLVALVLLFRELVLAEIGRFFAAHAGSIRTAGLIMTVALLSIGSVSPLVGPHAAVGDASAAVESVEWSKSLDYNTGYGVAVDESAGIVFATSNGGIEAKQASDGSALWSTDHPDDTSFGVAYDSDNDRVYFATHVGTTDSAATLRAVDASDGSYVWNYTIDASESATETRVIYADGTIYASGGGNVSAVKPDGSVVWNVERRAYGMTKIGDELFIGQSGGSVRVLSTSDGSTIRTFPTSSLAISLDSADGKLYAGLYSGNVSSYETDGSVRYDVSLGTQRVESVAAESSTDHVYAGRQDGNVYARELSDGSAVWSNAIHGNQVHSIYADDSGNSLANVSLSTVSEDGTVKFVDSGFEIPVSSSGGTYDQTFHLEDRTGLFPADRALIEVYELQGSADFDSWSRVNGKGFNSENKATFRLTNQSTYRIKITSGGDVWELLGYVADDRDREDTLRIESNAIGLSTPTPTPTATRTPGATPFPTSSSTATATSSSGEGPVYLGECTEPGVSSGINIEYWDPSYSTESFDYSIENDTGTLFEGTREFSEPIGYYRGCVGSELTNTTDPGENATVDYSGTYENGSTFNGSLDLSSAFSSSGGFGGGPVGSGADSPASRWLGYALIAGGGYIAYRQYGNGEIGRTVSNLFGQ